MKQGQLQQAQVNAFAEEQRQKNAKDMMKQRQEDYARMLEAQVFQRRQVMKAEQGMSEYEKRVNEGALKPQVIGEIRELPYKLPGIKKIGDERQEKHFEKAHNRMGLIGINQSMDFSRG